LEAIMATNTWTDGAANWDTLSDWSGSLPRVTWSAGAPVASAALVALEEPAAASGGSTQIISTAVTGPVLANGGNIVVESDGSIGGGPIGVYAQNYGIDRLTNAGSIGAATGGVGVRADSGETIELLSNATGATISGGAPGYSSGGGAGIGNSGTIIALTNNGTISGGAGAFSAAGGTGVSNSGAIEILTNSGAISGGAGGNAYSTSSPAGGGGAAVSNSGTIAALTNSGTISGGNGGGNAKFGGGPGGAAVANSGTITALINSDAISGGDGVSYDGGPGGAAVANSGTIATLINEGTISGGTGGSGVTDGSFLIFGGGGGAGVMNSRTIVSLTNSGVISGGAGGGAVGGSLMSGVGGASVLNLGRIATLNNMGTISGGSAGGGGLNTGSAGGAGVSNSGTIADLTNSGTIEGGAGSGAPAGDAIYSAGPNASIGRITNSGAIVGNVEIDNQASVAVTGGSGESVGGWTGGTITIGNGNLTFAGGNTALGDDIVVDGGGGTVFNGGLLAIAAAETIIGNFDQFAHGALSLDNGASETISGALISSGAITLDGASGDGGSSLTIGGKLTNGGTIQIGPSDNTLSAASTIDAGSLTNVDGKAFGTIDLAGSSTAESTLDVASAAGFGAAGVLFGDVNLSGDALAEFTSGRITTIAAGSVLTLNGAHAFVADASNTSSNSALKGLNTVEGDLDLSNGATALTSGALTNSGAIALDGASGDGGSLLHINGTLTNSGTIQIGPIHHALSEASTLEAASVVNDGTIDLYGNKAANANATLLTLGAFTNDGTVELSNDVLTNNDKIAGPVSGTGDFSLSGQSTLNFGGSVSSGEAVTFDTTRDTLILGQPSSFDGTIDDFFHQGDIVVAKGFGAATTLAYAQTGTDSCSLTLTDGASKAVLNFAGALYTQSDFALLPWYGGAGSAVRFV
jgi:hypothetical protein